jgi:hypothetical protein
MDREEVEKAILDELSKRKRKLLTRNALKALFGCVKDPVKSLGQLFMGSQDAIDAERVKIEQDIVLDLVCRIDDALNQAALATQRKLSTQRCVVCGEIEVYGERTEEITGVSIGEDAGQVELKPGTRIRASGKNAKRITGLKIGGN